MAIYADPMGRYSREQQIQMAKQLYGGNVADLPSQAFIGYGTADNNLTGVYTSLWSKNGVQSVNLNEKQKIQQLLGQGYVYGYQYNPQAGKQAIKTSNGGYAPHYAPQKTPMRATSMTQGTQAIPPSMPQASSRVGSGYGGTLSTPKAWQDDPTNNYRMPMSAAKVSAGMPRKRNIPPIPRMQPPNYRY